MSLLLVMMEGIHPARPNGRYSEMGYTLHVQTAGIVKLDTPYTFLHRNLDDGSYCSTEMLETPGGLKIGGLATLAIYEIPVCQGQGPRRDNHHDVGGSPPRPPT